MKKISTILFVMMCIYSQAQQAYYDNIDFNLRGIALKQELADLITSTHNRTLSYRQVWDALKKTDIDPNDPSKVIQLYGYNRTSSTGNDAYYNNTSNNGGGTNQWNREHTYAKSLGTPNLGESGPGADAHHLRPTNVQRNSNRGNLKFIDGSGNSQKISNGWYPGDEWKGDVARMMMYMYVRYDNRCNPANVGFGSTANTPDNMIDLFLEWNAEDPVSAIEIQRNEYLGNSNNPYAQGNRNPFIDNPYLATLIWGGAPAENKWQSLSTVNYIQKDKSYKTYTTSNSAFIINDKKTVKEVTVYNSFGQIIQSIKNTLSTNPIEIKVNQKGTYILMINGNDFNATEKVLIK